MYVDISISIFHIFTEYTYNIAVFDVEKTVLCVCKAFDVHKILFALFLKRFHGML